MKIADTRTTPVWKKTRIPDLKIGEHREDLVADVVKKTTYSLYLGRL